jgi:hypothetical protein
MPHDMSGTGGGATVEFIPVHLRPWTGRYMFFVGTLEIGRYCDYVISVLPLDYRFSDNPRPCEEDDSHHPV